MPEDASLLSRLATLEAEGASVALVTVVDTGGSAPRGPGARMIVHPSGDIEGTIGGGAVEAAAIRTALETLEDGRWRLRALALGTLEYREDEIRDQRAGAPLRFRGIGRWADARVARGDAVIWEVEYRVEGLPVLRARGRVGPEPGADRATAE